MTKPAPNPTGAASPRPMAPVAINFPHALPGFPGTTIYALEALPSGPNFVRLCGGSEDGPALVLMAHDAVPGLLEDADVATACAGVGLAPTEANVFLVVTANRDEVRGDLRLHVNRRAPVLIDGGRGLGFQVVLPRRDYAVRHPITA